MPNEDRSFQTLRIQVDRGLPGGHASLGVFSCYMTAEQTEFVWRETTLSFPWYTLFFSEHGINGRTSVRSTHVAASVLVN